MNARFLFALVLVLMLLAAPQLSSAQTSQVGPIPTPPIFPFEILFSIDPSLPQPAWVPQDGDELSDAGKIVATNAYLLRNFHLPEATAPVDYGLDAIFELRFYSPAGTFAKPVTLFSVKKGFQDAKLGWVSDGDLLSDAGVVVATNAQLMVNFHPQPPVQDVGLDAVFIPFYTPLAANPLPPEIWFSTNKGWFDEKLGHWISDGDLLSSRGYVVASNRQLLRNWRILPDIAEDPTQPSAFDLGLDAVYVPRFRPWTVTPLVTGAPQAPEIWFSVNKDFTDKWGRTITSGDLLSTSGAIVRTNAQLMNKFFPPTMGPVQLNYGLDAVFVRGRNLITILPGSSTVPKLAGNTVRLVFDGPVTVPGSTALNLSSSIGSTGSGSTTLDLSSTFNVAVATTNVSGDTLVLTEQGSALPAAGPCTIQPGDALDVEPFALNLTKLVGDINPDSVVNVGDLQQLVVGWGKTDASRDINGDNVVNVGDLQLMVANWGKTAN